MGLPTIKRIPETIAIGCRTAGGGVPLFYREAIEIGENMWLLRGGAGKPEVQGLTDWEQGLSSWVRQLLIVDFSIVD